MTERAPKSESRRDRHLGVAVRQPRTVSWLRRAVAPIALTLILFGCVKTSPFVDDAGRVIPGSIATMEMLKIGGIDQAVWFRDACDN